MAKFCATIIGIALFCLFTLSLAGAPAENDEATTTLRLPREPVNTETDSNSAVVSAMPLTTFRPGAPAENDEATTTLRLPSEPVNTETDSNSAVVSAMPLTTFRPVNRRFHVRSKHPCRHHFKFYPTMRENEVPYGNDMIVSSGENSDFEDPVVHGGDQRIPGRWVRLHHHHHDEDSDSDSDDDEDEDRVKKIVFKRYDYGRFDREKKLKVLKKLKKHFRLHQNEEEENKNNGGFMKRLRKFLDHYF